jgi:hypothetical protein
VKNTGSANTANHTAARIATNRMFRPSSMGMPSRPRLSPGPEMKPKYEISRMKMPPK